MSPYNRGGEFTPGGGCGTYNGNYQDSQAGFRNSGGSLYPTEEQFWKDNKKQFTDVLSPRIQRFREFGDYGERSYQKLADTLCRKLKINPIIVNCVTDRVSKQTDTISNSSTTSRGKYDTDRTSGRSWIFLKRENDLEGFLLLLLAYIKYKKHKTSSTTSYGDSKYLYATKKSASTYKDEYEKMTSRIMRKSEPRFIRCLEKRKFFLAEEV
jgi:hypothetical protein